MDVFLETQRLVLRRLTPDDAGAMCELDGDPEVMRYLTGGVPTPCAVVRDEILPALLREYERSPRHGRFAAIDRASGAFLGWMALDLPDGALDQAELGYRLRRAAWGRGYATEGARALVDAAFTTPAMRRVYAETMAVNRASRRVLEKAGLRYVRTFHVAFDDPIPGTEHGEVEYALTRDEWEAVPVPALAGDEWAAWRRVRRAAAARRFGGRDE